MSDHRGDGAPGQLPPPTLPIPTVDVAAAAIGDEWRRVHPATPLLRSWQVLAVALVIFGQDIGEGFVRGEGGGIASGVTENGPIGALIGVLLLGAVVAWAFLSWRMIHYRVTPDALELHQGVLSRQQRRAPLDRLQAVDITEPLVARIFGLAKLTLEVAGGGDSKIELAFLTESQARQLRNHLLAAAAGLRSDAAAPPQVGEAPEHGVITLPFERLIGSIVLTGSTIVLVLAIVAAITSAVVTGEVGFVAILVPVLLGTGGVVWKELTVGFGFRVASAPDGVRLRYGMLEQRTQTVPPGRVQAIRIHQPLLWRITGWWTIEVNVAGYGGSSSNGTATANRLLPVGTQDEVLTVLGYILPGLALGDAELAGRDDDGGFTSAPRRARWVDPIGRRRRGFLVSDPALLLRSGRLHRSVVVVPHARTQSCGLWQGPLQRRLGLASFELHSTPGPIKPRLEHLSSDVAAELLDQQSARSRTARATAHDDWLTPTPADAVPDSV